MTTHTHPTRAWGLRQAGVYYALLILIAALAMLAAAKDLPPYLAPANLTNIVYQSSLVGIMAVAMTVVLITGSIDLSVASVAALAAAVLVGLAGSIGFVPAMICALCTAAAIGILNGVIVELVGINAFIVTLATLTGVRGLVLVLTDGRSLMVERPDVLAQMLAFESGGLQTPRGAIPLPVVYLAVFTLLTWFALTRTVIGRRLYAVGGNAEAAMLSGIDVRAYRIGAFVLSSVAAGFAGVLFGCRLGAINPTAMQGSELTVIAAAILGGTSLYGGAGSVLRTVAGSLVLFTLTNGFNILNLGANYQGIIEGAVIIVAAAIYTVGGRTSGRRQA